MLKSRISLVLVGCVLAIVATLAAGAAGAVGPHANPGKVRPWSPQYMNGNAPVSLDQAVAAAQNFDAIVGLNKVYRPYVAQMKAANPNLVLFVYMKGIFTYDTSLPEGAYAHDASGHRIQGCQYSTWLLDPLSTQALNAQVKVANSALATSGYDGVFLDTLGPAALNPSFVKSLPVDQRSGKTWTTTDWVTATASFAGKLQSAIGKPAIANGLRDGPNYFDTGTSQLLATGLSGGMAEGWLRGATDPITRYPSEQSWKQNVDAVADAGSRGSSFLAVTKVWTGGTQAQKDAWYTFALASFLLGNDGHSYLSFSYTQGDLTQTHQWSTLSLGSPSGPYSKAAGVYQRSFSRGRVLVNPTAKSVNVLLGGTFHTLGGASVNAVTLAADTAAILTT